MANTDREKGIEVGRAADVALDQIEVISTHSENLGQIFADFGITLLVSTYQAGKLIVVRSTGEQLETYFRDIPKPMGIAVAAGQVAVGATNEIQFFSNVPVNVPKLEPKGVHDACFMQRYSHITGDIDVHEMSFGVDGQIWFINTRFSALCTLHGSSSFMPVWRPSFITEYEPEDRCHLNGLGMMNGRPRYITALGESNKPAGWRENKASGGILIDLANNRTLVRGLSMPHSPRWYGNQLWICESGRGLLSKVDYVTGELTPFFEFPGFTRGVDFHGHFAFVGLSQIRETATFSGLPITERVEERNCGIWVIDIRDASLVGILRFTQGVEEIFAVQTLPGFRCPTFLAKHDKLALQTFFLPPEILAAERAAASEAMRR
jgi:uncharacterized protein (TIGR03032 family)